MSITLRLRNLLDGQRFWFGIAYAGILAAFLAFLVVYGQIGQVRAEQARDEAIRVATADAALTRCTESIGVFRRVNGYLAGVRELAAVLEANALEALTATPRESRMWPSRSRSLDRIRLARQAIDSLPDFPAPTPESCAASHRRNIGDDG